VRAGQSEGPEPWEVGYLSELRPYKGGDAPRGDAPALSATLRDARGRCICLRHIPHDV
jgi:hypothetical protein